MDSASGMTNEVVSVDFSVLAIVPRSGSITTDVCSHVQNYLQGCQRCDLRRVKGCVSLVLRGDDLDRFRPHDPKGWIIPAHAAGTIRHVELRHLIEHLGVVLQ